VGLIYISVVTNVKHLFMFLLDICISSLKNVYSDSLLILKLGYLLFYY
jgi:hypothetical protein